jgi:hypothetical protein
MSFVKKTIDVSVAEGERVGLLCGLDGHLDEIVATARSGAEGGR